MIDIADRVLTFTYYTTTYVSFEIFVQGVTSY